MFSLGHTLNEHLLRVGHPVRHWEYKDEQDTVLYREELSFGLGGEQAQKLMTSIECGKIRASHRGPQTRSPKRLLLSLVFSTH